MHSNGFSILPLLCYITDANGYRQDLVLMELNNNQKAEKAALRHIEYNDVALGMRKFFPH